MRAKENEKDVFVNIETFTLYIFRKLIRCE
jgi:hypothetical protein